MKMITDFAKKHEMLPAGARVLCAVSGGADSMCLLHFLSENAQKLGITVCAAHFNHRLRGAEADRDQSFVEDWCKAHGIACAVGSCDVKAYAEANGLGIEEAAREKRYAFLEKCAEDWDCTAIATAHNADDNAETVLLNLVRGSGAKGLCGIPPKRDKLIRPLLSTTRAEIEDYLAANGIPYVEDSSNAHDDYTRNVLRHQVMPVLKGINPAFSGTVLRTTDNLRCDEEYLQAEAQSFLDGHYADGSLPVPELKALPRAVSSRVLRSVCGKALSAQQVDALHGLLSADGLAHTDVHGMRVTKDHGRLYFGQNVQRLPDTRLVPGGELTVGDYTVSVSQTEADEKISKAINKFYFHSDSICGTIYLTSRRDGDKIRLSGRNCTKSLKDLFSEAKMPQHERDTTPVLRDDKGVIAVYGFGVSERCAATAEQTALTITIHKTINKTHCTGGQSDYER